MFVMGYLQACTGGQLPMSECGPVWQLGIIAALLISAIAVLTVLRLRSFRRSAQG